MEKNDNSILVLAMMPKTIMVHGKQGVGTLYAATEIDSEEILKELYEIIECRCVGVQDVEIDGSYYDLWYDDEFLLSDKPPAPTALLPNGVLLMGNIVIAHHDVEGRTTGLDANELEKLHKTLHSWQEKAIKHVNSIVDSIIEEKKKAQA